MSTLIINADTNKIEKVKEFLKSISVPFIATEDIYDPTFVAKIERSRKQAKEGKTVKVKVADLSPV